MFVLTRAQWLGLLTRIRNLALEDIRAQLS
jgi:hypothetical protein